ncbi:hypothetical protein ABDD95_20675 [Mucilaginibacter sp. PAMB04274]|uniref:hypothetical protein n=1 Tax=Mucilaginibacter sp. PAMB04274 TaxID=3138568 RepID=UPI0031F60CC5
MKTSISNFLLIWGLSCLVLTACQISPKKEAALGKREIVKLALATPEEAAVDRVMDLEEVKRKMAEVEKASKGKRHLSVYAETTPTKEDLYYWIKVAENNGGSYVAYYTFAVDSKTRDVRYYDPMQDSLLTIEQWRKTTPLSER